MIWAVTPWSFSHQTGDRALAGARQAREPKRHCLSLLLTAASSHGHPSIVRNDYKFSIRKRMPHTLLYYHS